MILPKSGNGKYVNLNQTSCIKTCVMAEPGAEKIQCCDTVAIPIICSERFISTNNKLL